MYSTRWRFISRHCELLNIQPEHLFAQQPQIHGAHLLGIRAHDLASLRFRTFNGIVTPKTTVFS